MTGAKHTSWLLLGALTAALTLPRAAGAQTAAERQENRSNSLSQPEEASRAGRVVRSVEDDVLDSDTAGGEEQADNDGSTPKAGQRPAPQDGDLSGPDEPQAPVDGDPTAAEAPIPQDGDDAVAIDMRDEAERADFELPLEKPPAGYDPLLFQIEEIEPILSRKPERLFTFEPYDPVGIKVGSFVYFPETTVNGAWFSNVFSSTKPESDVAAEVRTKSRLVSNWKVHALEFNASSKWSFYDEFDSENDKEYTLEARGRLDVTRRTQIEGSVSHDRAQEGRAAIDADSAGDRPDVDTDEAKYALIHRFNRLKAELRGTHTRTDIGDVLDEDGILESNDDRDKRADQESLRLTYDLKPALGVFAETALIQRDYKAAAFSDGISRDTSGQRYRFGLDFGDDGKILRGEISLGYGVQNPDQSALDTVDAFLFDSNVTWRMSDITALRLTGRTDITETTSFGSSGVTTHSAGLDLRHEFRNYLIGTAGIQITRDRYANIAITDTTMNYNLGLEYFASQEIILFGDYEHEAFRSTEPDENWDSDEIRFGVRLRK